MNRQSSHPTRPHDPVVSRNLNDLLTPGVVVEVDPMDAEALGAFEETALDEAAAWEANSDLKMTPEGDDYGE